MTYKATTAVRITLTFFDIYDVENCIYLLRFSEVLSATSKRIFILFIKNVDIGFFKEISTR